MTSLSETLHALGRKGSISPEEEKPLLGMMAGAPRRSPLWLVVNPFDRFGGSVAAWAGLAIAVLSLGATRLMVRYDGFLDPVIPMWS
jgi:hypothetical protein